jgi:peptidoglycan/xylan/chitin deacetylase (PgdA/CDA1 family)
VSRLVLCYHAADADWSHALSLPPAEIKKQVKALRHRDPLVTFDDAFRSIAEVAPELVELGVRVVVFACPGYADGGKPLTVPELKKHVDRYPKSLATLTWGGLRTLAEQGVEIGSHTISHRHLPELSDEDIVREIRDSKQKIEAEVGRPCTLLAYPYGEEDARCRAAAREAGYEAAYTLPSFGCGDTQDQYAIPRIGLFRGDGFWKTALRVSPAVLSAARLLRKAQGRQ